MAQTRAWQVVLLMAAATPCLAQFAAPASPERLVDLTSEWEFDHQAVLGPFHNLYNPCIVKVEDVEYPYRMWFFGWAVKDSNPWGERFLGDAIFHARSRDLREWELYAGDDEGGRATWDTTGDPARWVPVVSALDAGFEEAIAGDPSVVWRHGSYTMAFSSVWFEAHAETTPQHLWVISCIMGARSRDGIHWERTRRPILIWDKEYEVRMDAAGGVFKTPEGYAGAYHRPSLMHDDGRWKLWFDYMLPGTFVSLGYAEDAGDFMDPAQWRVLNCGDSPQLRDWPNASVVKVGGRYLSFSDAPGYPADLGGDGRQITLAESPDGTAWTVLGHVRPEGRASSHVPEAFVTEVDGQSWLYVLYAWKPETVGDATWDFRYKEIRCMRKRPD
jgi:hypothetical protein